MNDDASNSETHRKKRFGKNMNSELETNTNGTLIYALWNSELARLETFLKISVIPNETSIGSQVSRHGVRLRSSNRSHQWSVRIASERLAEDIIQQARDLQPMKHSLFGSEVIQVGLLSGSWLISFQHKIPLVCTYFITGENRIGYGQT